MKRDAAGGKHDQKKHEEEVVQEQEEKTESAYGKFEFQNKILYVGYYKQNAEGIKFREGKGKLIHPTSDNSEFGQEYYDGDWLNDKMHGFGVYCYSNGDLYEGEWEENLHCGYGKYLFTDGSKYEGEWKEHKMHGSGKYLDVNGVTWAGEFRDGHYISKDQARLKEEKRIQKKVNKLKEAPGIFLKSWEDALLKIDKKNVKDILSPFFAKIENMGIYIKENFPKFDDRKEDKWAEALRFVLVPCPEQIVNVPKSSSDLIFMEKHSLLVPQIQDEINSGQVVEIQVENNGKKVNLGLGYYREGDRWLIVHFSENIEKKK
jgi:hypothetical protein